MIISKKVYDVFDYSKMREPYRTDVIEPMAHCRRGYEEDGWELIHMTSDYSIWVKANPSEWEIEHVKRLKQHEEERNLLR